jgi:hypothetical protein
MVSRPTRSDATLRPSPDAGQRAPELWLPLRREDHPGSRDRKGGTAGPAAVAEQGCDSENGDREHEQDPFPTHERYPSPSTSVVEIAATA